MKHLLRILHSFAVLVDIALRTLLALPLLCVGWACLGVGAWLSPSQPVADATQAAMRMYLAMLGAKDVDDHVDSSVEPTDNDGGGSA